MIVIGTILKCKREHIIKRYIDAGNLGVALEPLYIAECARAKVIQSYHGGLTEIVFAMGDKTETYRIGETELMQLWEVAE